MPCAGTQAFRETWVRMADTLCELAAEDEARGRLVSAGEKYKRAASYLITAERLQAHGSPDRMAAGFTCCCSSTSFPATWPKRNTKRTA